MTGDQFRQVIDFENNLRAGHKVRINWTNSGNFLTAKATVVKVNEKSVVVTLDQHVWPDYHGGWPVGHRIRVPRIMAMREWSCNNCVQPLEETATV
jgi:hypothetical protein